jgi:histidinol-phosphate/aromatic aminotransferase/cobyric acid decarboxylase-like protein
MQPGFHSSQGNSKCLSDFRQSQAVHEPQPHHLRLAVGESIHRAGQFVKFRRRQLGGRSIVCRFSAFKITRGDAPPLPLHRRDRSVSHDRIEERDEFASQLESGEFSEQVQKSLLHHFGREMLIASESPRQRQDSIAIAGVERFESASVAAVGGGDEFEIGLSRAFWGHGRITQRTFQRSESLDMRALGLRDDVRAVQEPAPVSGDDEGVIIRMGGETVGPSVRQKAAASRAREKPPYYGGVGDTLELVRNTTHTQPRLRLELAAEEDRPSIYRLRHEVYAAELGQYPRNEEGQLVDRLDEHNLYIVARVGNELVGCISITPPGPWGLSLDKHAPRSELGKPVTDRTWEVRLLTVAPPWRSGSAASLLMYAALRLVEERGGDSIIGMGRREIMPFYQRAGLEPTGRLISSGSVTFEVMGAGIAAFARRCAGEVRLLKRLEKAADWNLSIPFRRAAACYHGGAFFGAIGESFDDLSRRRSIINADVLDAWFPPAPGVLADMKKSLSWIVRTSPPTGCDGFIASVAQARGVRPENILPGSGSSDLIFRALRHWLSAKSRVLILDPMYGEYAHVLEQVIGCEVDRLTLRREDQFDLDPDRLVDAVSRRRYDAVIIVNPNSPTGRHVSRDALAAAIDRIPSRTLCWVDETYVEYAGADQSLERFAVGREHVVICKSMSKMYALSGVRAAYLCASSWLIEPLREITPPWVIGLPGQIAAVAALRDPAYYAERWAKTHRLRRRMARDLAALGLEVIPGVGNFLLCHLPASGSTAKSMIKACVGRGLFLRDASAMGSTLGDRAVRTAVKDAATNREIIRIVREVLEQAS